MEKAVSVLQGHTWKNKQIKVKVQLDDLFLQFLLPLVILQSMRKIIRTP